MTGLGLTLFAIGAVGLLASVIFALIDKQKTGICFGRRRSYFPWLSDQGRSVSICRNGVDSWKGLFGLPVMASPFWKPQPGSYFS